jgi:hypothetical protein
MLRRMSDTQPAPAPAPVPVAADDPRPEPPPEPALEDCCGTGCVVCVFDVYEFAVENYERALAAWQARHPDAPA